MTSQTADKFMLRLPDGMRDAIKATAESNFRSMNTEIVARLTDSLGWSNKRPTMRDGIERAFWEKVTRIETGTVHDCRSPIRGIEIKALGYSVERQMYGISVDLFNMPGVLLQPSQGPNPWVYGSIMAAISGAADIAGQFK